MFLLQGRYKFKFSLQLIRLFLTLIFYCCRLFPDCDYKHPDWHCTQKAFIGVSLSLVITDFIVALIAAVFSCVYTSLGGNEYRENSQRGNTIYIWQTFLLDFSDFLKDSFFNHLASLIPILFRVGQSLTFFTISVSTTKIAIFQSKKVKFT